MTEHVRLAWRLILGVLVLGGVIYLLLPDEPLLRGRTLSGWLEALNSPVPAVREQAGKVLVQMSPKVLPHLVTRMKSRSPSSSRKLLRWLRHQFRVEYITETEEMHRMAIRGFEVLGPLAVPAIPDLLALAGQGTSPAELVQVMVAIGPLAVPSLGRSLQSPDPSARALAARALGRLSASADEAVPNLVEALKDPVTEVRSWSAQSLGEIGKRPRLVVPALSEVLKDEDARVRLAAVNALRRYGTEARLGLHPLLQATNDPDPAVRTEAAMALDRIAPGWRVESRRRDGD